MSSTSINSEILEPLLSSRTALAVAIVFVTILFTYAAFIQDTNRDFLRPLLGGPKFTTEITSLRIYPIKSCRGIQLSSRRLLKTGLELDRNWMFVDDKTKDFITIRQQSKMTLINTALEDGNLHISISGTQTKITIPAPPTEEWLRKHCELAEVEIWEEKTDGWLYSADLTAPFSDLLGIPIRLVYKGPTPRILVGNGSPEMLGRTQHHHFADMMSVLVASESSISELNERLARKGSETLTIERFRPNIVVRGGAPWAEDVWKSLRIRRAQDDAAAAVGLDVPVRCLRCQVPNVDPDTGIKNKNEPWYTLMKYRNIDVGLKGKPVFGVLCVPRDEGLIEVGMRLEVMATTKNHVFNKTAWKDL
jgi:uncharacterized protein